MLSFPSQHWRAALRTTRLAASIENPRPEFDCGASEIIDRVFLSDYGTACNARELKRLGITHVISVIDFAPRLPSSIVLENRLHIRIRDSTDEDLLKYMGRTTEFIKSALEENSENKVLVGIVGNC